MITYDSYPDYYKCLCKLTHYWVKRSRFNFDELMSEANIGFITAVDSFDDSKACFHTHLFITVNGRLRNYTNQKDCFNSFNENINLRIESNNPNPEQVTGFKLTLESLSREASEVVETVLNTPAEMIELVKQMSENRGVGGGRPAKKISAKNKGPSNRQGKMHLYKSNVTRFFQGKGWSNKQINSCYSEIKSTFNWG